MASRIQGITVEIGGDTTKLQTALKGLNGEIKSTQTALKDVEKLLKMDPGNTELLAQKEKLLAQAVDETKQKLETLKTAAEQANTALANGDISQEQYDALQREIVETEQNLRSLETQANQSATAVQKIAATGESLKTTGDNISNCAWSVRQLERQINSFYYERILATNESKRAEVRGEIQILEPNVEPKHLIKDPYILEFLGLEENKAYLEHELEQGLIDNLQKFLLELGKGFCFVARQRRITIDGDHYYIDLVFYNYILKCFVLIDLKTHKLTYQDVGQIDFYVKYFEENVKTEGDNPTIGIVLCSEKNETMVKYSVLNENDHLFASKYKLYIPTEEELKKEIERERFNLEQKFEDKNE